MWDNDASMSSEPIPNPYYLLADKFPEPVGRYRVRSGLASRWKC